MSDTYSFGGGFDFGGMPMGDWMQNEFFPNPPPMPPQPQPPPQPAPTYAPPTPPQLAQDARDVAAFRLQAPNRRDADLRNAPPLDTMSETYKFVGMPESTNVEDRRGRGSDTVADNLALLAENLPIQEAMDVFMPPILMDYLERLKIKPVTEEMLKYGEGLSEDAGYWDVGRHVKRGGSGAFGIPTEGSGGSGWYDIPNIPNEGPGWYGGPVDPNAGPPSPEHTGSNLRRRLPYY